MTNSAAVTIGVLLGITIIAASFGYIRYVDRPRRQPGPGSAGQDQVAANSCTLATEQFEALTHCPGCGTYGPHLMREPRHIEWADIEAWERRRQAFFDRKRDDIQTMTVASWGGGTVRTITNTPNFREPRPFDESEYTTIRVCECGTQWGQI